MPSYDSHTVTAVFVWRRTHRHSGRSVSWTVFHTDTLWLPSITVWLSSLKITWLHWTAIAQRLWSDTHESRFLINTLVRTMFCVKQVNCDKVNRHTSSRIKFSSSVSQRSFPFFVVVFSYLFYVFIIIIYESQELSFTSLWNVSEDPIDCMGSLM